jgi:hypothetical protein
VSIEIFMRELWLLYRHQKKEITSRFDIKKAFLEYVLSGEPFELIDGDNNVSLVTYYKDLLRDIASYNTFYLSILGP